MHLGSRLRVFTRYDYLQVHAYELNNTYYYHCVYQSHFQSLPICRDVSRFVFSTRHTWDMYDVYQVLHCLEYPFNVV